MVPNWPKSLLLGSVTPCYEDLVVARDFWMPKVRFCPDFLKKKWPPLDPRGREAPRCRTGGTFPINAPASTPRSRTWVYRWGVNWKGTLLRYLRTSRLNNGLIDYKYALFGQFPNPASISGFTRGPKMTQKTLKWGHFPIFDFFVWKYTKFAEQNSRT